MQPVAAEVVRLLSRVLSISRDKRSPVFPKPGRSGCDVSSAGTVSRFIAFAPDDGRVLEKHGYNCPAFCRSTQSRARKEVDPEDQNEQLPGGFSRSAPLLYGRGSSGQMSSGGMWSVSTRRLQPHFKERVNLVVGFRIGRMVGPVGHGDSVFVTE
jgi:hypothetical protein